MVDKGLSVGIGEDYQPEGKVNLLIDMEDIERDIERRILDGIAGLIISIRDEEVERDGLAETPMRFLKAMKELTRGYQQDPAEILARVFDEKFDEMIVVRGIEFNSLCEHHLLPFIGTAQVGYIPNGSIVGLSKLARLVDCFANRLQVQERLTTQIADAIETHLEARGVGVVIRARHLCMGCRGVKKPAAEMVTAVMRGAMKNDPKAREEFLNYGK
jgi:GTP cyclohydrolase I